MVLNVFSFRNLEGGRIAATAPSAETMIQVFSQAFFLTFLAEWGDRSQVSFFSTNLKIKWGRGKKEKRGLKNFKLLLDRDHYTFSCKWRVWRHTRCYFRTLNVHGSCGGWWEISRHTNLRENGDNHWWRVVFDFCIPFVCCWTFFFSLVKTTKPLAKRNHFSLLYHKTTTKKHFFKNKSNNRTVVFFS